MNYKQKRIQFKRELIDVVHSSTFKEDILDKIS